MTQNEPNWVVIAVELKSNIYRDSPSMNKNSDLPSITAYMAPVNNIRWLLEEELSDAYLKFKQDRKLSGPLTNNN